MATAEGEKTKEAADKGNQPQTDLPQTATTSDVLSGAEQLLDGENHCGIAILVASDGVPSTLMIPDVGGVKDGKPVFITKPIRINGENLKAFLQNKGVSLPDPLPSLIENTQISCEAFYWTKAGPMLMMFAINFKEGLIKTLTGDPDLEKLFTIQGAAVRVIRCPKGSFDVLKQYAAGLSA